MNNHSDPCNQHHKSYKKKPFKGLLLIIIGCFLLGIPVLNIIIPALFATIVFFIPVMVVFLGLLCLYHGLRYFLGK